MCLRANIEGVSDFYSGFYSGVERQARWLDNVYVERLWRSVG